jgi:tripartite ATP-independent transporter DctP family solute receptor
MMIFRTAAVALAVALSGVSAQAQTTLNLGHVLVKGSHYSSASDAFGAKLEELSGGKFSVREHASGSLGGERDMIEGLSIGTVDVLIGSTAVLSNFSDQVTALDLPFLFDNYQDARATLDSQAGADIFAILEGEGFIPLAWIENGFRHLSNSRHPVRTVADMKNLKIRTQENALHIEAFGNLGASPTPLAFPELFAALQQGVIDGQENPLPVFLTSNFFEVQKHLSLTGHVYGTAVMLVSPVLWERLSEEERGWMREAAPVARDAARSAVEEMEADALTFVKDKGVEIVADPDKAAFKAAIQGVYETFRTKHDPAVLDLIQAQ